MFIKNNKIKIIICICFIILLLLIVYLYSNIEKFDITTLNEIQIQRGPMKTLSTAEIEKHEANREKYKSFGINKKELILSIGPCSKIEITANNMNLVGIILVDRFRNNIFNNNMYKIGINDNIGKYISTPVPTTPSTISITPDPTRLYNTNINDLFLQTNKINNLTCDFNQNIKDSNNNILLPYIASVNHVTYDINIENYILDPKIMFTTPDNTQTTLEINIPQEPNQLLSPSLIDGVLRANSFKHTTHLSSIILCLNNNIDNTIMLNSLNINVFDLNNESIAMWQINQVVDPATNFLRMILNKPNDGQDLSMYNENFLDIPAIPGSINTSMLLSNDTVTTTTKPDTTTTKSNTTTTKPDTTTTKSNTTTTKPDTTTTKSNTTTTKPDTIELKTNESKISQNPYTKLFQQDFNGSSNIYTPFIYY
jgi:hypothetical protein